MDVYGVSTGPECFRVDDFLDLSNEELFSADSDHHHHHHVYPSGNSGIEARNCDLGYSGSFAADDICVPIDDVAQLEWLSTFVEDSFTDFPSHSSFPAATNLRPDTSSSHSRPHIKRSRSVSIANRRISSPDPPAMGGPTEGRGRQCSHCLSVQTPQWRAGPMGPKTLCNACGVRYKSGRLVPEYRPASSPTFVLTQHSNSHRKVMELRRQKEMMTWQQQQQNQEFVHHQYYHHEHIC